MSTPSLTLVPPPARTYDPYTQYLMIEHGSTVIAHFCNFIDIAIHGDFDNDRSDPYVTECLPASAKSKRTSQITGDEILQALDALSLRYLQARGYSLTITSPK